MRNINFTVVALITIISLLGVSGSQVIGNASIYAPAVILYNNTGVLTRINLTVTNGNGTVIITGPRHVGNSTNESAITAAEYASKYLGLNYSKYNFDYYIENDNTSVSGPSAGMAMTLLGISALSGMRLRPDFTLTGTISPNGSVGEIGGVYDKVSAAKLYGMHFVLVPEAPNGSTEDLIYLLTQDTFGLPLVQVANITDAVKFAFAPESESMTPYGTRYNLYVNYNIDAIPNANVLCTGGCNISPLSQIQSATLNVSNSEISNVSSIRGFAGIGHNLSRLNNESQQIASKGYVYLGADIEFLDYIDAYMFANHLTNITDTYAQINYTESYCSNLNATELTDNNYQYVIGGELRASWANYTLSSLASVNRSQIDTDTLLRMLTESGESYAWCRAAQLMYNKSGGLGGSTVTYNQSLKMIAKARIDSITAYQGIYLSTAESLYSSGNYGAALLDADYAYAEQNASLNLNRSAQELDNLTRSIASTPKYGVWATQFADDALFYANESSASGNATYAYSYALSAYQTAVLSAQISNDTSNIYNSLVVNSAPTTTVAQRSIPVNNQAGNGTSQLTIIATAALVVSIIALIIASAALIDSRMRSERPKGINKNKRD